MRAKLNKKLLFSLAGVALASTASATLYTGTSGGRSASADFTVSGTNLVVVLTNTASSDATAPTDMLTGVFFSLAGNPTLTRTSGIVTGGSGVFVIGTGAAGPTGAGNSVGCEFAYANGISGPGGADEGISSSGLGLFGPTDVFPGCTNLEGPADPDGIQYGITTASDNLTTGNGGITGSSMIRNSVTFTLSGIASNFNTATGISNISFQYGTALTEPNVPGSTSGGLSTGGASLPEPGSPLALLALGGALLALTRRKSASKA